VNFDYPNSGEDYIHRIGRTARANKTGTAYTFFTDGNGKNASELVQVMEEAGQTVPPKLSNLAARNYHGRKRMRYSSESDDRKYSSGSKRPGSSSYGSSSYGGSSAKRAPPAPSGPPRSGRGGYSSSSSRGNSSSGGGYNSYNNQQNGYSGGSSQTGGSGSSSSNWNQSSSGAPASQPTQPTWNPSQQNGYNQQGADSGSAQQWATYQKQMADWQQKNQQWQQWQQTQGSSAGSNPY